LSSSWSAPIELSGDAYATTNDPGFITGGLAYTLNNNPAVVATP